MYFTDRLCGHGHVSKIGTAIVAYYLHEDTYMEFALSNADIWTYIDLSGLG